MSISEVDPVMGKSRAIGALALIGLVVSMATFGVASAQRAPSVASGSEERTRQLLQILDNAQSQVQRIFEFQESRGVRLPEVARNRVD
ncbi:MAG: hypothetical protein HY619_04790, partial [Thaumarchaeota archaeon]|nr:hypothetical protein [Nitrososphaerota archaeon]